MASINKVIAEIKKGNPRSAWAQGVKKYALELLDDVKEWKGGAYDLSPKAYEREILNGASSWKEYSWGGSALIYDEDIAKRLSTKSELKVTRNGERRPNAREEWLDTQARALYQASRLIGKAIAEVDAAERAAAMKKASAKRRL